MRRVTSGRSTAGNAPLLDALEAHNRGQKVYPQGVAVGRRVNTEEEAWRRQGVEDEIKAHFAREDEPLPSPALLNRMVDLAHENNLTPFEARERAEMEDYHAGQNQTRPSAGASQGNLAAHGATASSSRVPAGQGKGQSSGVGEGRCICLSRSISRGTRSCAGPSAQAEIRHGACRSARRHGSHSQGSACRQERCRNIGPHREQAASRSGAGRARASWYRGDQSADGAGGRDTVSAWGAGRTAPTAAASTPPTSILRHRKLKRKPAIMPRTT